MKTISQLQKRIDVLAAKASSRKDKHRGPVCYASHQGDGPVRIRLYPPIDEPSLKDLYGILETYGSDADRPSAAWIKRLSYPEAERQVRELLDRTPPTPEDPRVIQRTRQFFVHLATDPVYARDHVEFTGLTRPFPFRVWPILGDFYADPEYTGDRLEREEIRHLDDDELFDRLREVLAGKPESLDESEDVIRLRQWFLYELREFHQ